MNDLPIYSDAIFRNANPFASLDRARALDLGPSFARFARMLDCGKGHLPSGEALRSLTEPSRDALIGAHGLLFAGRDGSGLLRGSPVTGPFPGQDCPDPEFIAASLTNFEAWLSADSFREMHPIEQAALALTRIVDIWPFEFGNRRIAVVFANQFLVRAGYPPFFVLAGQTSEFGEILAEAIRMHTEPLVRAIYKCLEREIELVEA